MNDDDYSVNYSFGLLWRSCPRLGDQKPCTDRRRIVGLDTAFVAAVQKQEMVDCFFQVIARANGVVDVDVDVALGWALAQVIIFAM